MAQPASKSESTWQAVSAKEYENKVRDLGCILCQHLGLGKTPASIHHVESIRDELSAYAIIPLCYDHHQGANGVHGLHRRAFEMRYKLKDIDMLARGARELNK